jgi:predicted outer membrane protein
MKRMMQIALVVALAVPFGMLRGAHASPLPRLPEEMAPPDVIGPKQTVAPHSHGSSKVGGRVDFFLEAAAISMKQGQLAELGELRASSSLVKEHAAEARSDAMQTLIDVKDTAARASITLPPAIPDLSAEEAARQKGLEGLSEKEFDGQFMSLMIDDQVDAIRLYEAAAKSEDTDVAAYANRSLPALRTQLADAIQIKSGLVGGS